MMKTIFFVMLGLLVPAASFGFPNDHKHNIPDDFRVACKTWGFDKSPSNADFVWDSNNRKMIITGDSISDDNGRLVEGQGYQSTRSISYATTFWKGDTKYRPDTKTLYMTFRDDNDSTSYHGQGWSNIRTFKFQIRKGELGSVIANEATYVEGILDMGHGGVLEDCSFSGIYANP
jgi:hypothetical protein